MPRPGVYGTVARAGGGREVEELFELYTGAADPALRRVVGAALAQSQRHRQVLDWAVTEAVRWVQQGIVAGF